MSVVVYSLTVSVQMAKKQRGASFSKNSVFPLLFPEANSLRMCRIGSRDKTNARARSKQSHVDGEKGYDVPRNR